MDINTTMGQSKLYQIHYHTKEQPTTVY